MNLRRLLAISRKEVLQLSRDRRSLALAFLLPLLLLVLFGYAISFDVHDIPTAVWDGDRTAASRSLLDAFWAAGYFTEVSRLESAEEVREALDRGTAQLVLVVPPGFSAALHRDPERAGTSPAPTPETDPERAGTSPAPTPETDPERAGAGPAPTAETEWAGRRSAPTPETGSPFVAIDAPSGVGAGGGTAPARNGARAPASVASSPGPSGGTSPAVVQAIVDGSDANTATIALAYAQAVVRGYGAREIGERGVELDQAALPLTVRSRVWYNEELRSRNMIVPGLVAVIMMIIAAMLTSLTLAREWERGTMEQLAATPVGRAEVVIGKLLPYVAIGLVDVVVTSVVGVLLFRVPFRGSALLLGVFALFFLLGASGLGIFVSAGSRSQLTATQVALVVSYLPSLLLSGFMFAIATMPAPLRALTYLVPARYFLVVTRGIFLKGVGIDVLAGEGLLMVAFAVAGVTLAVLRFRKELL